jgi:3-hydroxyacyl-CoA dehydrogenase
MYIYLFNLQDSEEEAENFVTNALSNLKTTLNVMEPIQKTDLVVEAVVENINIKQKVFSTIDKVRIVFALCI